MFTGIVEELGTVVTAGTRLEVRCSTVLSDLSIGASIAVNGVCLTAVAVGKESFAADLAPETLSRNQVVKSSQAPGPNAKSLNWYIASSAVSPTTRVETTLSMCSSPG